MMGPIAAAGGAMLLIASVYLLVYAAYYLLLALVGLWPAGRRRDSPATQTRFVLLVPAHDEERTITGVLRSLQDLTLSGPKPEVLVVADNCDDHTADVARALGTTVLTRMDPAQPGKGPALEWAFARLLADDRYDAVCVFDADNRVAPDFLLGIGAALADGAEAVQGYIDTKNPAESWLSGVSAIVYWSANRLFQLPRSRLGFGAVLGGTGFCLTTNLLRRVGWNASALTEDLEYQAQLTLAGVRVAFAPDARVFDEKPANPVASMRQRLRWMQGYWDVMTRYVPRLMAHALRHGSMRGAEMALYAMAPPRSLLAVGLFSMGLLALALPDGAWLVGTRAEAWFGAWLVFSLAPLLAFPLERAPARAYRAIPFIPLFALSWAPLVLLGLLRRGRRAWSHTPHRADPGA